MDTTTSNLPSSLSDVNGDARNRTMPPFQRVATSPDPSGVDAKASSSANGVPGATAAMTDAGENAIARVVDSLHDAVDDVADKAGPIMDRLEDAAQDAGNLPRQWMDAAREVIRGKPLVALSGALVIGAALLHLVTTSRR